ncbi:MAG: phosphatidate cytidylyltransferase [Candidatus Aminicenantaceae bacterium]
MLNTRKRLPTAIIILAIVFFCIQYLPSLGFLIALQIVILVALLEFYYLPRKKNILPHKILGSILALSIGLSFYSADISLEIVLYTWLLVTGFYFVASMDSLEKMMHFPKMISLTFFGAIYVSFTLNHIFLIREDFGPFFIYFLLLTIVTGDSAAFTFGKLFGKHPMTPFASPKKTWEGSVIGILFAVLGGLVVHFSLLKETSLWKALVFAFLIHAVAQISDPFESLFKRASGMKDSSNILPGHGGFLDRIDSLILAAPLFYYLLTFFGME